MMPPARVLAAVDFSESSRAALACAARLAHQSSAQLHVIHVPDVTLCRAARARGSSFTAEVADELRLFAAGTAVASTTSAQYHVVAGGAGQIIRDIARRECCDVIVVGTHGLSGDDTFPFGSTTEELLRDSELPVLVVPAGWLPPNPASKDLSGIGPLIVGLDFTCPSMDAAMAAAQLAAALRSYLLLVHVVAPLQAPARWHTDIDAITRDQAAEATDRAAHILATLRSIAPAEFRVEIGNVAACLTQVSQSMPGGLLVLGRARRPRSYGPPGALASRILARAHIPVLLHMPSTS